MRCPDCNKFVSLDTDGDPEVDLDVDADTGAVTGTVRIVNACGECGAELTEATFDVDLDFPSAAQHMEGREGDEAHELELEEPSMERTSRSVGRGRGTKTFYGAEADITVKCSCGKLTEMQHWSDESQASHMTELN